MWTLVLGPRFGVLLARLTDAGFSLGDVLGGLLAGEGGEAGA
jgi:hypothetical protein